MMKVGRKELMELVLAINKNMMLGHTNAYVLMSSKSDMDNKVGQMMTYLSVEDFNELKKELKCYVD